MFYMNFVIKNKKKRNKKTDEAPFEFIGLNYHTIFYISSHKTI